MRQDDVAAATRALLAGAAPRRRAMSRASPTSTRQGEAHMVDVSDKAVTARIADGRGPRRDGSPRRWR